MDSGDKDSVCINVYMYGMRNGRLDCRAFSLKWNRICDDVTIKGRATKKKITSAARKMPRYTNSVANTTAHDKETKSEKCV